MGGQVLVRARDDFLRLRGGVVRAHRPAGGVRGPHRKQEDQKSISKTNKLSDTQPRQGYKKKIEGELYDQCMSIVDNVKDKCMKVASTDETKAFFYKMIGDYYRYVAESAAEATLQEVKEGALKGYEEANKLS